MPIRFMNFRGFRILTRLSWRIYIPLVKTTLQKWGNSQGIRIPKTMLDSLGISVGSEVEIEMVANTDEIRIRPTSVARPVRGRYRIEDLVARMPEDHAPSEEAWGGAVGEEIW